MLTEMSNVYAIGCMHLILVCMDDTINTGRTQTKMITEMSNVYAIGCMHLIFVLHG